MTLESNVLPLNAFTVCRWPTYDQATILQDIQTDHLIVRNGAEFAASHIIIDFRGASGLDDVHLMEYALRSAAEAASATLLHLNLSHLAPGAGVSGVVMMAEARLSVHTWPACDFAAFDIFNWGNAEAEKAIPVLQDAFQPRSINVSEHLRGTSMAPANDNRNSLQSTDGVSNDPFFTDAKNR